MPTMRRRRLLSLVALMVLAALVAWWSAGRASPDRAATAQPVPIANVAPSPSLPTASAPARGPAPLAPRRLPAERRQAPLDAGSAPALLSPETLTTLEDQMRASAWLARHAEFAQQTVDQYCAQARAARAAPLFEAPGRSRDAAPFLLPLIDWEGATDRAPVFGLLHLPQELSERLSEATADTWPLALADAARGLDYAWMKQALAYDHWDISNDLRFQDQPARWLDATIPNFLSLQHWSKLRLAHGLERGDAAQAAAEVRHLANLCHSTGILLASMVAIALRGLEATAREVAVARGLDVSAWPATTEAQRTNSRKATRNAMYYFLPGVSPEVMKRAAACAIDPCTALAEGLGMHRTLGAYSSRDTTEALNQVIEQSGCTGALVDRARAAAPLEHPSFLNAGQIDQLAQYLDAGW